VITGFQKILPAMVLVSTLVFSACSGAPGSGGQKEASVKNPGQEVFLNYCMGCHMGAGDPPGPNDVILKSPKMASIELFKKYIRQPDNDAMPPISQSDVSDADVGKLYEYLKSVH
jgi:mono/diheme cytochrome c family protein